MQTKHRRGRGGPRTAHSNTKRPFRKKGGFSQGGGKRGGRKMPTFNPSQFINKNPVDAAPEVYTPTHTSFAEFGLSQNVLKTIEAMGISAPSPIQDQIIPEILKQRDVIGLAETGTGKTAAFLVPLIERILAGRENQILVLTPTRELALQIEDEFRKLSRGMRMYSVTCIGGVNIRPQMKALRHRNEMIIGTPGRVLDLINRGILNMEDVSTVVLDEADRMLDMGFIHDMRAILTTAPKDRSTLFFSATMTPAAQGLVSEFLNNPVTVSVKKKDVTDSIAQDIVPYSHTNKFDTLVSLLKQEEFRRVIIFGAMKHSVEKLSKELTQAGIIAESIHGNKSHGQRQRSLKKFKSGNAQVLVATDVAARGIHVDNISHVINYDLPGTFEDYVHRIGRTGRGSKKGMALTFVPERSR